MGEVAQHAYDAWHDVLAWAVGLTARGPAQVIRTFAALDSPLRRVAATGKGGLGATPLEGQVTTRTVSIILATDTTQAI